MDLVEVEVAGAGAGGPGDVAAGVVGALVPDTTHGGVCEGGGTSWE